MVTGRKHSRLGWTLLTVPRCGPKDAGRRDAKPSGGARWPGPGNCGVRMQSMHWHAIPRSVCMPAISCFALLPKRGGHCQGCSMRKKLGLQRTPENSLSSWQAHRTRRLEGHKRRDLGGGRITCFCIRIRVSSIDAQLHWYKP